MADAPLLDRVERVMSLDAIVRDTDRVIFASELDGETVRVSLDGKTWAEMGEPLCITARIDAGDSTSDDWPLR